MQPSRKVRGHGRGDSQPPVPRCHSILPSLPSRLKRTRTERGLGAQVAACESPEELYTTVLIDAALCPVGKYFQAYMEGAAAAKGGGVRAAAAMCSPWLPAPCLAHPSFVSPLASSTKTEPAAAVGLNSGVARRVPQRAEIPAWCGVQGGVGGGKEALSSAFTNVRRITQPIYRQLSDCKFG